MNANEDIDQAALEVAEQWLALIDAGDWKESLNQNVTLTADPDGRWRVSGYHIVLGSSSKFRTAGNPN